MSNTSHQNIILSKIDKFRTLFLKEIEKGRQVVICSMKYLDIEVLDAFCLVEDSEYGKLDHIIIEFKAPLTSYDEYSSELVKELLASFNETRKFAGEEDWILKNWNTSWVNNERNKKSPLFFFKVLQSMIDAVPGFDAKIFVFLSPKRMENKKGFSAWIDDALSDRIPSRCGILVAQNEEDAFLTPVAENHPRNAALIHPDLKMDEAIKQMATAGNPANPDVQFRKCFFNMQEGVAKKDAFHIINWRNKAKEIACKMNWKDMIVTTDLAAGTFMLHLKETEKAIDFYNQAIENGKELIKTNLQLGNPYTIQAIAAKGAALLSKKNYFQAISIYTQLGEFATEAGDFMNAMEGWRMAGYCFKEINQKMKALECYKNALQVAEKMNPELRPHTTLPYVGKELFELTPWNEKRMETLEEIDYKMKKYAGDEWQSRYK